MDCEEVKRKIGILALGHSKNGGVIQYTQSLIDSLPINDNYEFIFFTQNSESLFFISDNYEIRNFTKPRATPFIRVCRAISLLLGICVPGLISIKEKENFEDIDLFVSPCNSAYPHYFLKKPFIFTLHDMQERYYPNFFSFKERITRFIVNRGTSRAAKAIICESSFVKNDIVRFLHINEQKVKIIQSPPPKQFLDVNLNETQLMHVKLKYKLPDRYLFYPAQCWPHKNHIRLLKAFKTVCEEDNQITLILSGSEQNNYLKLVECIHELGLESKVKHLGHVEYRDIPALYKLSKMLIMPTLFESISIPIYEAFSLEIPVCCSNVVGLPEQVNGAALLFDPFDEKDISSKIMQILNNPDLQKKLGKDGNRRLKKLNHETYSQKILEVIFFALN